VLDSPFRLNRSSVPAPDPYRTEGPNTDMSDEASIRSEAQPFGEILEQFEGSQAASGEAPPSVGDKVKGRVSSITPQMVFIDLGGKAEAGVPVTELLDKDGLLTVGIGDEIEATVTGRDESSGALMLRRRLAGRGRGGASIAEELRQAKASGLPVEGIVTGFNKGGAEVKVAGMRCFCPTSQLDLKRIEDPAAFVGQRLAFKVERLEEAEGGKRPNVVLSRRKLLEEEAAAKASETRSRLAPGAVLNGRVTSLTPYGAFVDLGGVEGLLHVSEISHSRLAHPSEALTVGQELEVQVLKIDVADPAAAAATGRPKGRGAKSERISLSRKALEGDPWSEAPRRFPEGTEVLGKVRRLETFGAFVEVAPGLEGLLHISELGALAGRRLAHAREGAEVGQDLRVRIQKVEPERRRISLGAVRDPSARPIIPAMAMTEVEGEPGAGRRGRGRRRDEDGDGRPERGAPRRAAKGGRARRSSEDGFGEDTAIGMARSVGSRDRDRDRDRDREPVAPPPTPSGPPPTFGTLGDFFTRALKKK
jgi:small subunit ribosomal protein S1